jgi:hypothetical protein
MRFGVMATRYSHKVDDFSSTLEAATIEDDLAQLVKSITLIP